jgi:Ca2+-binding EF-hand superfamily protein
MHIFASSSAYGSNPLQQVLGMLYQQPSSSTGQNSPGAAPADAATPPTPPTLSPPSPGRQFASETLAALLGVQQQQQSQAPSASDIAGKVISQADGNGDGQLSQSEIAQALGVSGSANDGLTQAFSKLDANGDGKLSADELTSAIQQQLAGVGGRHHHHGGHKGVSSQDLASKIIGAGDTDGDGSLSQSELQNQLGKGGVSMSSSDFAAAFGKLDTNGDGTLSGAELAAAIDALRNKASGASSTTTAANTATTTPTTTGATA